MKTTKKRTMKMLTLFLLSFIITLTAGGLQAKAAGSTVEITKCLVTANKKKVQVKVNVKQKTKEMGKKLYLLALDAETGASGTVSAKPVAQLAAKKGALTFSVKYKSTMLYQQFAVACKSGSKYKILSNACFITNPEILATYTGTGVAVYSKKGVQAESGDTFDPTELRAQYVTFNWCVDEIMNAVKATGIEYKYRGKKYYFNKDDVEWHDRMIQSYINSGARVNIILLLRASAGGSVSPITYGTGGSAAFSSINTTSAKGCRLWEALMSFLAERYGQEKQLVSGWILGNEIDQPAEFNYNGGKSLDAYMADYARAFRIAYNAVRSVSKNTYVYVSVTHNWNYDHDGDGTKFFGVRNLLDTFNSRLKKNGKITFRIAYHAYPHDLLDAKWWNKSSSEYVSFSNLSVLTDYAKKNYGSNCKITLSEQSFNTKNDSEDVQAAAYARAYYLCEGNSMIESFIYGRDYDNDAETSQGFYWGLWKNNGNGSYTKRKIWYVLQNIDSKESLTVTNHYVSASNANLSSWDKAPGYKASLFSKMPSLVQKAKNVTSSYEYVILSNGQGGAANVIKWDTIPGADGYEISCNNKKIATVKTKSTETMKLDLYNNIYTTQQSYQFEETKKGEYDFKVRMFKTVAGKKKYGGWSEEYTLTIQ